MDAPDRPTASASGRMEPRFDTCGRPRIPGFNACRCMRANGRPYILRPLHMAKGH